MDLTPLIPEGKPVIQGYGDMGFRISGQRFEGAVIVYTDRVEAMNLPALKDLDDDQVDAIINAEPGIEILLVGCGKNIESVPTMQRRRLRDAGIAAEMMDTGAACRTFNLLLAEERRVAALLVPVP